ncbi:MAG TPA: hypothetical protein VFW19_08285 [Allosphingosinicella sp.]|nr:hypothetical protein [Allosphingosinicella sp.]
MSEEDEGPGPESNPAPEPPLVAAPDHEDRPANIIGGIFLIGCGLCLLLVGGGCTGLLLFMLIGSHSAEGGSMLVVSLAILAAGIFAIVQGVRMARGRAGP